LPPALCRLPALRIGGFAILATVVLCLLWRSPAPYAAAESKQTPLKATGADRSLFLAVVHRLQDGEPYYPAMGSELHARGYPTASVWNWRPPLYLFVLAAATIPGATALLLGIIGLALAWLLRPMSSHKLLLIAGPLAGMTGVVYFAEAWAGALIALSLAAYCRQRWTLAAVCGVFAVFFRELAVIYAVSGGILAFRARRKRESVVWILGGIIYIAYFLWHSHMVYAAIPAGARSHPYSWVQWGGLPFLLSTLKWYAWVAIAPGILGPLVLVLGLLGTVSAGMPIQARVALLAYSVGFMIVGHPFNTYWGLVTLPLWSLAVVSGVDGWQRAWGLANLVRPVDHFFATLRALSCRKAQPAASPK
jgi:hypothetical protein